MLTNSLRVELLEGYLSSLASADPTPGGGSASAIVAAQGAALLEMVARITLSSEKRVACHDLAREIVREAESLRTALLSARTADEDAYSGFVHARSLPKVTEHEQTVRASAMEASLSKAAEAPLTIAELSDATLALAVTSLRLENSALRSDIECAAEFSLAAARAAGFNVRINHRGMKNSEILKRQADRLSVALESAESSYAIIIESNDAMIG